MSEPDLSIGSYDEVRFYRRTWFVVLLLLFLAPLILPIVLTGPYFQKARPKQREESPAAVWRSTGSGRVLFAVISLTYAVQAIPVVAPMISDALDSLGNDESAQSVTAEDDQAVERAEPSVTTVPPTTATTATSTTAAPTTATAVPTTTTIPITTTFAPSVETSWTDAGRAVTAQRLANLDAITSNMAEELLGTNQAELALVTLTGDSRLGDNPIPDDAELTSLGVSHERANGRSQIGVSLRYRTLLSAVDAVSFLRAEYGARGFVEGEIVTSEDNGETMTDVGFEPLLDDVFTRESITVEVTDGDDGVTVRVFRFIFVPEWAFPTAPLALVDGIYPVPIEYETIRTQISMGRGSSDGAATWSTLRLSVTRPEPDLDLEVIKDDFVSSGGDLWTEDRRNETALYLNGVDLDVEAYFFVSSSDVRTIVKLEVSL